MIRASHEPPPLRTLRVGAVSYLNSKPLVEGLAESLPEADVVLDFPSRLADDLAAGELDVALVPSVECLLDPDDEIVSDACVVARGPVLSVKLCSRVPVPEIRSLALDEGSRTSAMLARVMLAERYALFPQLEPLPLGRAPESVATDALLVIGDRAMFPAREPFVAEWDLGEEWYRWTGLPFVFAVWAARKGTDLGELPRLLCAARDRGVAGANDIARREAPLLGIDPELARRYLTCNLHFTLGSAERSGLRLFRRLVHQTGLAPEGVDVAFRPCETAR